MAQAGAVEVEGLAEFRRALSQVDKELSKELKRGMKTEVAEPLAEDIKAKVPVRSGTWRKVIRGGATARNAYIQWGRSKVPYAAWMEFGGGIPNKRNRRDSPRLSRPFKSGGRYVHPTVEDNREQAGKAAADVLEETMKRARLRLE